MRNNNAFTLIELIVVVAIVGILTSIAYPLYDKYVVNSKRSDGMAALMSASQAMERYKVNNYTYNLGTDLSKVFATQVPVDGGNPYYTLTLESTSTTYTLTATPTGSMAGKEGPLSLTHTGARTWNGKNCWPEGGSDC